MTPDRGRPARPQRSAGEREVFHGELASRRGLRRRGLAWLAVPILWLLVFLVLPMVVVASLSFATRGEHPGTVVLEPSGESYRRLAGFSDIDLSGDLDALLLDDEPGAAADDQHWHWRADNLRLLWRSVWLSTVTTVLAILIGLPIAFYAASASPWLRALVLGLVTIPFCTNLVVRVLGWELFLSAGGPAASALAALGLPVPASGLYPGIPAVLVAMVSTHLSFAVLPLYGSVERIDHSLVEAARDLGAGAWRTFRHGVLPQISPGLGAATILTFMPALGTFLITDRLGGGKTAVIGNLVQQQVGRDIPYMAALSVILVLASLVALFAYRRIQGRLEDQA